MFQGKNHMLDACGYKRNCKWAKVVQTVGNLQL